MSDLNEQFEQAKKDVTQLPQRPDNDTLLALYALYKQATEGDVSGDRPGGFDLVGAAKYDARVACRGMSPEQAKTAYVELVRSLVKKR